VYYVCACDAAARDVIRLTWRPYGPTDASVFLVHAAYLTPLPI
jgi:hypothetical protein